MDPRMPGPIPCLMCTSEDYEGVKVLVTPRPGRIELSSRFIDAAVYECRICGAVRQEPLRPAEKKAA